MGSSINLSNVKFRIAIFVFMAFIPFIGSAQLSGTYTIDPAGAPFDPAGSPFPNFVTFQTAVDSLHAQGVNGAVVINVADGTYTEQINIYSIGGVSAANTITFQSESLDSTKVILTYQSTLSNENWTLLLNGTDYITFRKMKFQGTGSYYARVIHINGNAHHIIIENCQFWNTIDYPGDGELIYSVDDQAEFNTIRNNYFINGDRAIMLEGINYGTLSSGTQIYNNHFVDQQFAGIDLTYQNAPSVHNNTFSLTKGGTRGIYMNHCYYQLEIRNNIINNPDNSGGGIELEYCFGDAGQKGLIKNNFIRIGGYKDAAIGINIDRCEHINIFHNSVNITSTLLGATTGAFVQKDAGTLNYSSDIDVRNNNFANTGGGYAYNVENAWTIINSDHNNYYATGEFLAQWNGSVVDLQALQESNSMDVNSVSVNPRFQSETDLHTNTYWLDGLGATGLGITADIDGETRLSPPDIGADEFTPITPLTGIYKIGGGSPDYFTVKEAFDDLQVKGISGPVTFEIRNGEYPEFIGKVNEIPGTSAADTIVLKSESGNPEDVVIHYATDDTELNLIEFIGVDHFTLRDLSITATGETYGRPLRITKRCNNINIINNIFSSGNITNSVLSISSAITDGISIVNNSFSKGSRGIYFYGDVNNYSTNTSIAGNSFSGSETHGMALRYHISPRIINNTITNTEDMDFSGMELRDCEKDLRVIGNTISNSMGKIGIRLHTCIATSPFNSLVANNMIHVGGIGPAYGIIVYNSKRANIYHNSVNTTSTDSILGRGMFIQGDNEDINMLNNIFANNGTGYALFVDLPEDIILSDYNGLYTSGSNLASWGGTISLNLDSLTAASGMENNSVFADPEFISETDLHTDQIAFYQAGTSIDAVLYDIDSLPRDPSSPTIGAMEFYCDTPYFEILVEPTCFGDTTIFVDNSSNITSGADYGWDFNGDWTPDYNSTTPNEAVQHFYDTPGIHTLNFIIGQKEGCTNFISVPVEVIAAPVLDISTEGAYCGEDDGQANVSVIDGTGSYAYYWSTGSTDSLVENLALGAYSVAVTDTNGCISSGEAIVSQAIEVTVTELKGSTCGKSDGIAEVEATGGAEPYSYVWTNGATIAIDSFMSPGLHFVNVIDDNDCYTRGSVVIGNDGSGPEITKVETVDNDCFGEKLGAIDIDVTGGVQPYDFLWSNGALTEDIDNLKAGIYDILIVDNDSCPTAGSFIVQQPQKITIGPVVKEAGCADNDGRAAVLVKTHYRKQCWRSGRKPEFYYRGDMYRFYRRIH